MGNPGKPKCSSSIQHFSHQHQLQLLNIKTDPSLNLIYCVGCKVKPSEWVYACKPCNFILDISCSQMPQRINHPADPNHMLSLIVKPAYSSGIFRCDACGGEGDSFNYHCSTCGLDIHIICATMPLSLTHQTHPHPLNLAFSPPNPSKDFCCDICDEYGSDQWVYRCNPCDFDAHLNCATHKPSPSISVRSVSQHLNSVPGPIHQYLQTATTSSAAEDAKQSFIQKFEAAQKVDKERMLSMIQGRDGGNDLIELRNYFCGDNSATRVVTEEYVQSILGGHSGGDDRVSEQIDPDYVQNNLGNSNGDSGDNQQDDEEALEALILCHKIDARSRQAQLDSVDSCTYIRTSYLV